MGKPNERSISLINLAAKKLKKSWCQYQAGKTTPTSE